MSGRSCQDCKRDSQTFDENHLRANRGHRYQQIECATPDDARVQIWVEPRENSLVPIGRESFLFPKFQIQRNGSQNRILTNCAASCYNSRANRRCCHCPSRPRPQPRLDRGGARGGAEEIHSEIREWKLEIRCWRLDVGNWILENRLELPISNF